METIKFRGKSKNTDKQQMVFGYGYYFDENDRHWIITDNPVPQTYVQVHEVQQFTGLHDKAGKEIWEGDILKNKRGAIRIIFWDTEMASWYTKSNTDEFLPVSLRIAMTQSSEDVNFLEIIGNIYSNPELLKN